MAKIIKNQFGNFLVICSIFLMVTVWIFSGWPRIWQNPLLPPKIKIVKASPGIENLWSESNSVSDSGKLSVSSSGHANGSTTGDWASAIGQWAKAPQWWEFTMENSTVGIGTINTVRLYLKHRQIDWVDDSFLIQIYDGSISDWADVQAYTEGSGPPGSDTTNDWNVKALGIDNWTDINSAKVRIIGNGAKKGEDTVDWYVDTVELRIDYTPLNTAPTVAFNVTPSQSTDGDGKVTVNVEVDDDDDDDTCKLKVEYSTDGSNWEDPTIESGTITADFGTPALDNNAEYQIGTAIGWIETSSGSNTITFVWLSATDESTLEDTTVYIKVTVHDGTEPCASPPTSSAFTVDNVVPTISTLSPDDNEPAAAINSDLVITFSEAVDAKSGNINLYKTTEDELIQAFDVTKDITGSGTDTITADPSSNLDNETDYYVKIDATAFDDASSNSFAGITDKTTWNFTTVAPPPTYGNIDTTDEYSWGENIGWTEWRPFYGGATVADEGLSGYIWAENIGWIKLGDDGGPPYGNTSSSDWGVNNDVSGNLSGYAWGENVGWIIFKDDGTDHQVVIDESGYFTGYAWGENIGWINMNCANTPDTCETVYYKVKTDWKPTGPNITITSDGEVAYGIIEPGATQNTVALDDTQTVRNNGETNVNLKIKSSDAEGTVNWVLATSQGDNTFIHNASIDGANFNIVMETATDGYVVLKNGVEPGEVNALNFDLLIGLPSAMADYEQHNITITVMAEAPP